MSCDVAEELKVTDQCLNIPSKVKTMYRKGKEVMCIQVHVNQEYFERLASKHSHSATLIRMYTVHVTNCLSLLLFHS